MFKYRRNRVLALCAGERRLLTMALLSFRNKLVASGKPTEDINELLIRLLRSKLNTRNERLLLKRGRRLFLWHQFCCHTDELRNGHGITFDAIDEKMAPFRSHEQSCIGKWLRFGAKTKNFPRGVNFSAFSLPTK